MTESEKTAKAAQQATLAQLAALVWQHCPYDRKPEVTAQRAVLTALAIQREVEKRLD